jgi:hypothetical protein
MIFSFYLGIGLTIIIGYVNTTPAGLRSAKAAISTSFLFASILMMILTVAALRVVASIPISLPANWIIRITQVRAARDLPERCPLFLAGIGRHSRAASSFSAFVLLHISLAQRDRTFSA